MALFSLSREHRPAFASSRRRLTFYAFLALSTPVLLQTALGGAVSSSTEEAMALLSRPGPEHSRNYHGVVHFDRHDRMRQEITAASGDQPGSRTKNRMNDETYPPKDQIPDVNHPQVKAWVAEIDWSKVPNIPVAEGLEDAPHFPKCPPDELVDKNSCWWSCDGCVQSSDVITCPGQNDWGLTYDDGPSEATREMMQHLSAKKLSATFFIVGSRVLEYPDILKEQVEQGHHIAMHTWSHAGLTTLTNEQIVAEIRWSEKIIRDVTGLTMKYVRPPYGDVDNRVREILRQMGYTTVIWTLGWDTNDWRVAKHQIQTSEIIKTFQNALDNRALIRSPTTGQLAGPITLEHDLTDGTIDLSKQIIPMAMDRGLKPMSLSQCLSDDNPYQGAANGGAQKHTKSGGANHGIAPMNDNNNTVSGGYGKGDVGALPASKGDSKSLGGDSKAKSDASVPVIQNGLRILSYTAMSLTLVASYMLTL